MAKTVTILRHDIYYGECNNAYAAHPCGPWETISDDDFKKLRQYINDFNQNNAGAPCYSIVEQLGKDAIRGTIMDSIAWFEQHNREQEEKRKRAAERRAAAQAERAKKELEKKKKELEKLKKQLEEI